VAIQGVPYTAFLIASGGRPPYSWRISSGELLPGLRLHPATGAIEGRALQAGKKSITVVVQDSSTPDPQTASAALDLEARVVADGDPELPREFLETAMPDTTGYRKVRVAAGDDFQVALDGASCNPEGSVLLLEAGATFMGNFRLPAKDCAPGKWIVVQSAALSNLPPEGNRVSPAHAAQMPRILTPNSSPAVSAGENAKQYRLVGLEIAVAGDVSKNFNLVFLGVTQNVLSRLLDQLLPGASASERYEAAVRVMPQHIVIDRCYIHGNATGDIRRGVALNGRSLAVVDSHLSDFHEAGAEAQAILGWSGPGPLKIVNNYLEGAGENVMFGGADPGVPGLVPSDIEFRRNHLFKPLSWRREDPSFAGKAWTVKNLFELKNAQRVLVEGNVLENNWLQAQTGYAILFTPRGEDGRCRWCRVEDVTFRYNVVRHSASGFTLLGRDRDYTGVSKDFLIEQNIFDDLDAGKWASGCSGNFLLVVDGPQNVRVDHNTAFLKKASPGCGGWVIYGASRTLHPSHNFRFTNNIARHLAGVGGDSKPGPDAALAAYFPEAIFTRNVLAGGSSQGYPRGNFFPSEMEDVRFVDFRDGNGGDYRLCRGKQDPRPCKQASPYRGAGTDGKDLGADAAAVAASTYGVTSTSPPARNFR
jgi:hypothetical protein